MKLQLPLWLAIAGLSVVLLPIATPCRSDATPAQPDVKEADVKEADVKPSLPATGKQLRKSLDEWERFWDLDYTPKPGTPFRTHGGIID